MGDSDKNIKSRTYYIMTVKQKKCKQKHNIMLLLH